MTTTTHEVLNQPEPLAGHNLFETDRPLREAVEREGAASARDALARFGGLLGGAPLGWGEAANANPPRLRSHDRYGNRVDEVEFHPAWHELMRLGVAHGLHAAPWREPGPGAQVARAAFFFLLAQVEAGVGCPLSMTYASVPALREQPELAAEWEPRLLSLEYDPRLASAAEKRGALCGMAMTEKQGGSDVRANTTRARPLGRRGPGSEYELTGHKWFCSAPMSDAFLVLAQAEAGLSCFLLPRVRPDGSRNRFHLQRLKDKLGNRSNASAEVELQGAFARLVGEEGRGLATILEMVNHTRLDCVIGSAAGMRQSVAQALNHATQRSAFGRLLIAQPLMRNVLADLCLESEAATALAMRLARAYDEAGASPRQRLFARLATAVAKYWVCKRTPPLTAEALECLGGNGYVEESGLPRLYREAPVNSVWEGSGNVICLDVLRVLRKQPESAIVLFEELRRASGRDPRLDAFVERLERELADAAEAESGARRLVEGLALALQGALLVSAGDPAVAGAFCAARLAGDRRGAFGTLPAGLDLGPLIERSLPVPGRVS